MVLRGSVCGCGSPLTPGAVIDRTAPPTGRCWAVEQERVFIQVVRQVLLRRRVVLVPVSSFDLAWLILVRTGDSVDGGERLVEVVGEWVGGGDGVVAGLDFDGAVAAGGVDETFDAPAGEVFDPAGDFVRSFAGS